MLAIIYQILYNVCVEWLLIKRRYIKPKIKHAFNGTSRFVRKKIISLHIEEII